MANWNLIPLDERLVSDLLRGRGKSIDEDLDVGEEGFKQTIVTLQSLHHSSDGYQHTRTRVGLAKKAYPCKCNWEHKQEQERMQLYLLMNEYIMNVGLYKSSSSETILDRLIYVNPQ
jgi:hypothetical protein